MAIDATAQAEASPLPGGRIQGAVTRPKDGLQHPDLNTAWAEYDKQIVAFAEAIERAIETELNAAAAAGDLDSSLKWKTAGEEFRKNGKVPEGLNRGNAEGRLKPQKPEASPQSQIADAQKQLAAAYEAVEKSLVKSHDLEGAQKVRAERTTLSLVGSALSPFREAVFLSDLPAKGVSVGHGTLGINGDMGYEIRGDKRAVVNGKQLHKSISMHPPTKGLASATFDVPSGSTHFEGSVAIHDAATNHETPLIFKVYGDKHLLWASKPLKGPGRVQECRVALKEAKTVTLIVECPGRNGAACSIWIDPQLLSK